MIPLEGFHRTFLHKGSGMCEKLEWNCGRDALFVLPGVSELFFSEGHAITQNHYSTVRGPDVLRNVIVSGYVAFYQHCVT